MFGWELLAVCHHPDKRGDHRHCDYGDMFLICHMTLSDHMFKGLCEFMGGSSPGLVITLSCLVPIDLMPV